MKNWGRFDFGMWWHLLFDNFVSVFALCEKAHLTRRIAWPLFFENKWSVTSCECKLNLYVSKLEIFVCGKCARMLGVHFSKKKKKLYSSANSGCRSRIESISQQVSFNLHVRTFSDWCAREKNFFPTHHLSLGNYAGTFSSHVWRYCWVGWLVFICETEKKKKIFTK